MTFLSWLLLVDIPKPEQFWPVTGVGWITVFGFIASTVYVIFQTGRWAQKFENHKQETETTLDGFGSRVGKLELGQEHEEGRVDALEVQLSRTQGQYEALIQLLGEAKTSVDHFREGMRQGSEKIERKIDDLRREQTDTKLEILQRLTAVETTLHQRGKE